MSTDDTQVPLDPSLSPPPDPPASDGKVECPECHKPVRADYLANHLVRIHDIGRKRPFRKRGTVAAGNGELDLGDLSVDAVLTQLVEARWPVSVPTRKLRELVEVRAVLERFLG